MHAFAPGYHVWFGTPTAGDVLKIVLEKKELQMVAFAPGYRPGFGTPTANDEQKVVLEKNETQPTTIREGIIETVADKAIEFTDGLLISTDAETTYTRLADKGEQPAERKEFKSGIRVRYERAPGKGATKVVILPTKAASSG